MSLAVVRSRAPAPGRAPEVTVEVHLANGLPSFSIVGLPDLEVRESRERVRAALQNCGFEFPVRRIRQPCPCRSAERKRPVRLAYCVGHPCSERSDSRRGVVAS
ncbi:magnesium chelatase domain-containing protein [uncultured Caballeronia sp.]|uniref:magnesium chelatase domain-containing protein n=1 Tax=uncultured Caballeronia sp. TaxID=1827198 RepID=UPI0035CAEB79